MSSRYGKSVVYIRGKERGDGETETARVVRVEYSPRHDTCA